MHEADSETRSGLNHLSQLETAGNPGWLAICLSCRQVRDRQFASETKTRLRAIDPMAQAAMRGPYLLKSGVAQPARSRANM